MELWLCKLEHCVKSAELFFAYRFDLDVDCNKNAILFIFQLN